MELRGALFFLVIGVAGCLYPFLEQQDRNYIFRKSDKLYCDGDNT